MPKKGKKGGKAAKSKQSASRWVLMKIPSWLAQEWFDDSKYTEGSTLGYLEGGLASVENLRKDLPQHEESNISETKLIVDKGEQIKLECPSRLNAKRQERSKRTTFKHGRYTTQETKKTNLIFEANLQFSKGSTVLAAPEFDKSWQEGTVQGLNANGTIKVKFSNGSCVNRTKDQLRLPEASQEKAQTCKLTGIVDSHVHISPEMNTEYARWLQRKSKKRGVKRARTEKKATGNRMDRIHKYINTNSVSNQPKKKKRGPKRVKEKDEIYRKMILHVFDSARYLDKTMILSLTEEPWTFLSKHVVELCDRIQDGGEYHNHYQLKEEYRVGNPDS